MHGDNRANLVVETAAGEPGNALDREGLLATVGFPLQTYPGTRGGPFQEFFAQPRDLTGARIRTKLS